MSLGDRRTPGKRGLSISRPTTPPGREDGFGAQVCQRLQPDPVPFARPEKNTWQAKGGRPFFQRSLGGVDRYRHRIPSSVGLGNILLRPRSPSPRKSFMTTARPDIQQAIRELPGARPAENFGIMANKGRIIVPAQAAAIFRDPLPRPIENLRLPDL